MSARIISSVDEMITVSRDWQQQGVRIGFVPTMGNLHDGHLKLVEEAKKHSDKIVVSIFVNPLQFGPSEDLDKYPRTLDDDLEKLEQLLVDIVFAPDEKTFYPKPPEQMTFVEVPGISDILCGASRPDHFRGVTTVVNRLFNIVRPDVAVFGTKDYQQFSIIQQMVTDLAMPVELIGVETVREADGLAMSSRNKYLTKAQREIAPEINKQLQNLKSALQESHADIIHLQNETKKQLNQLGFRVDYLEVRDANTLQETVSATQNRVILTAVYLGDTRLIDNIRV